MPLMPLMPLSLVIITKNAGESIERCIRSVPFADEVLVIDSGSTDETVALAEAAGARVIQTHWRGFGPQKQFACAQAKHDWVLSLDADEELSPMAQQCVAKLKLSTPEAYAFARQNRLLGQWLRHGEGFPDWNTRLFHREVGKWSDDKVHERLLCTTRVQRLERAAVLMHRSAESLPDYVRKQIAYTQTQAERQFAQGRRGSVVKLLGGPALRFVKYYVFRLGFLDGLPGLVLAMIGARNAFYKQIFLFDLGRKINLS
ncbi:MAG: hypothetical protein RLZZ502_798 [Pseudomonadota bacterium]|jgi:glycosyltransferase involved in cell wall biosynthesis